METRANYIAVGSATLIGVLLFMLFALWISASQLNRQYDRYEIAFEGPVRGLARGGEVRFQGIKVGEVTELRINPDNANEVLALVRVDASTPVRSDSIGQLEPVGLTGVNLIQLSSGTEKAPLLRSRGDPPRIRGEASEIDKLLGAGGDIAQSTSRALLAIEGLLNQENVERVSNTLANIEAVSESIAEQRELASNANAALARVAAAAGSIERLSRNLEGEVGPLTEEARLAVTELRGAVAAARGTLEQTEAAASIAAEQSLPDFAAAVQDIRRLTDAVDSLAVSVQRNPSQFVSGVQRPVVEVRE